MYCTEVVARTNNSLGLTAPLGPAFLGLSVSSWDGAVRDVFFFFFRLRFLLHCCE